MIRFILLSLALHALVTGVFWRYLQQQDAATEIGTIALVLHAVSEPVVQNMQGRTTDTGHKPPGSPDRTAPARIDSAPPAGSTHAAAVEQEVAGSKAETVRDSNTPTEATPLHTDGKELLESLRRAVYGELRANFSYPRRARLRGWEGTVVIALRILPDGQLANIRIADSSGISTLDRAAVDSLKRVSVPQVVAWLHGQGQDITIPVEYRLIDG